MSVLVKLVEVLAEAAEQLLLLVAVDLHCDSSVLRAWVSASMQGKLSKGHCNISCLVALVPPDSVRLLMWLAWQRLD